MGAIVSPLPYLLNRNNENYKYYEQKRKICYHY